MEGATETREGTYAATPGEIPRGTLVGLFFEAGDRYPDGEAFRHKVAGRWSSITHRQLREDVERLAAGLAALGLERGDRAAILSENRPEWALADYACLCAGIIDVPIYATLPAEQIEFLLADSGARLVFVSTAEQRDKILQIRAGLPELRRIVSFEEVAAEDGDVLALTDVMDLTSGEARPSSSNFREAALAAGPDDTATILYTSGTTGTPKGVMLTHDNIHSNAAACRTILPLSPDDTALSLLPLSHIFERMVDYLLFAQGVSIAYAESIETVPANLLEVRPTIVASVPRLYEKIHARVMAARGPRRKLIDWALGIGGRWADARLAGRRPSLAIRLQYALADRLVFSKLRARTGGRLRFFISGGAPLSPDIARFFYSAGVLILEGYGLTETSPVTNVNTPDAMRIGTVGRPIPGTEVRIAEDGEILVRGRQVMKGYFNRPDLTAEVIDAEGWFHTGDIGVIDEDGFLRITDRKKEIIVTAGGKNIAPAPIEQRVKSSRFITEAVMVGDRRPYAVLLLVPDLEALGRWAAESGSPHAKGADLLADPKVMAKLRHEAFGPIEGFASFERPKKIGLLLEEFTIEGGELTPTMKVRRRIVEEKHASLIERLYETDAEVIGTA